MDVIRAGSAEGLSRKTTDACGPGDDVVTTCSKSLCTPMCQLPHCMGHHFMMFPTDVPSGQGCEPSVPAQTDFRKAGLHSAVPGTFIHTSIIGSPDHLVQQLVHRLIFGKPEVKRHGIINRKTLFHSKMYFTRNGQMPQVAYLGFILFSRLSHRQQ